MTAIALTLGVAVAAVLLVVAMSRAGRPTTIGPDDLVVEADRILAKGWNRRGDVVEVEVTPHHFRLGDRKVPWEQVDSARRVVDRIVVVGRGHGVLDTEDYQFSRPTVDRLAAAVDQAWKRAREAPPVDQRALDAIRKLGQRE